jgi:Rod binding domain-containing protein
MDSGNFLLLDTKPWTLTLEPRTSKLRAPDAERQTPNTERPIRKVAEEFASLLLLEMLKSMRTTLSSEGLDGNSSAARDNYLSLADIELTRSLAKDDGMGLTAFLERALSRGITQHAQEESALVPGNK